MIKLARENKLNWDEILPIVKEHHKETAIWPHAVGVANPDTKKYDTLMELDVLKFFTVRDNGRLVGYASFMVQPHMHHQDHVFASCDSIYVHPDYRKSEAVIQLVQGCEEQFRDMGVSVVTYCMKVFKPFQKLMEMNGYDHVENTYGKVL